MKAGPIITYLIFIPSFVIALMLIVYMVEIIDMFYNQFWDVMANYDGDTKIFRPALAAFVILLTVVSIFGMENASTRSAYYMSLIILLCLMYIFCSWATEWIVVFNVNNTLSNIHDLVRNQVMLNKSDCIQNNFPYAHKLLRLIPCCGYDNVINPNDSGVLIEWTCFEFLECTGRLPPNCKDQIDIWLEENLVPAIVLLADFRIMCIILLINILIFSLINFDTDSDND